MQTFKKLRRLSIAAAYLSLIASTGLYASNAVAKTVELTRQLAEVRTPASINANAITFDATVDSGRLIIVNGASAAQVNLELNGASVGKNLLIEPNAPLELTVNLQANNLLTITATTETPSALSVRVTQAAELSLHVNSRVHFNTNVHNFVAARAFYEKLGFKTLSGFPDTNTIPMAHAIGISTPTDYDGTQGEAAGGYLLHGELIGVGGYEGGLIDLIEFTIPKNEEAPYHRLNHLGMASATMHTAYLDADYKYLTGQGVNFLSAPVTRSNGSRFAVFTDQDGTYYELVEVPDDGVDLEANQTHITGLGQVNINVSDLERSVAWYQMMGYEVVGEVAATESIAVANAMGFAEPFQLKGKRLQHPEAGSTLRLTQWLEPFDPEPAYPLPVNHLGIHRMAYSTEDIAADVATLRAQGVKFVSPVTPCCSGEDSPGSIVAFFDPDGTVIELVEQPFMAEMMSVLAWFKSWFD